MIQDPDVGPEQLSFDEEDFVDQEESMDDITQADFERLCNSCFELKNDIAVDEAMVKEKKLDLSKRQNVILAMLQKYKKQNTTCAAGMLYQIETTSVKLPQDEDKRKFFAYLKEKGCFEDMVHVNSRTFNKFYQTERDAALEEGNVDFVMPGVGEETVSHKIGMRKG